MGDGSPAQTADAEGSQDDPTLQTRICHACGADFEVAKNRVAKWCPECRPEQGRIARRARYYADPKAENADRERWRQDNRERDNANERERKGRDREHSRALNRKSWAKRKAAGVCELCANPLRDPSPSGLCGFCEATE